MRTAASRNLDAATPPRAAETELQNAVEVHATLGQQKLLLPQKRISAPNQKSTILKRFETNMP